MEGFIAILFFIWFCFFIYFVGLYANESNGYHGGGYQRSKHTTVYYGKQIIPEFKPDAPNYTDEKWKKKSS